MLAPHAAVVTLGKAVEDHDLGASSGVEIRRAGMISRSADHLDGSPRIMSKSPALFGFVALGAGLVFGLLPQSETYSDYGFEQSGVVDINCGSALSPETDVHFHEYEEGVAYRADSTISYEPAIFEGQTATEVCDEQLSSSRTAALVAAGIGVLLLVIAFVRSSNNKKAPPAPFVSGASSARPPSGRAGTTPPPPSPPGEGGTTPPPQQVGSAASLADPLPSSAAPPARTETAPAVVSSDPAPAPAGPAVPPSSASSAVVFADGRRFGLEVPIVIGRSPSQPEAYPQAAAVPVDDFTVSKTHLLVGRTGEDVWVEDLQSRNGISVRAPNGMETQIAAGRRAILDDGDRVIVGDTTSFVLEQQGSAEREAT